MEKLSENTDRNRLYNSFLETAKSSLNTTTEDLIKFGHWVMVSEDLSYNHSSGNAELDSQYLAFSSLQLRYEYDKEIYRKTKVSVSDIVRFITLLEKRISQRLPLPYVTNEAWYLGWRFYVNENTLVPRSVMNHKFREFLQDVKWSNQRVLDLCTGSGCIGVSLALLDERISVDLVDVSSEALMVAKVNIESHHLTDRVRAIQSHLFTNVEGKYDFIITNPPYLTTEEYNSQCAEYQREPKIALEAGEKGLVIVKQILNDAWKYMNQEGVLIAEIGSTSQDFCIQDYPEMPFEWVVTGLEKYFNGRSGVFKLKYGYQDYWKYS
jgi:ribosomal protein L3 glutamine methyltransferase